MCYEVFFLWDCVHFERRISIGPAQRFSVETLKLSVSTLDGPGRVGRLDVYLSLGVALREKVAVSGIKKGAQSLAIGVLAVRTSLCQLFWRVKVLARITSQVVYFRRLTLTMAGYFH